MFGDGIYIPTFIISFLKYPRPPGIFLGIFRAKGHFLEVRVYKLPTPIQSRFSCRLEGHGDLRDQPSRLTVSFGCPPATFADMEQLVNEKHDLPLPTFGPFKELTVLRLVQQQ